MLEVQREVWYENFVWKRRGKRPLTRPNMGWENNVKISSVCCDGMTWMILTQNCVHDRFDTRLVDFSSKFIRVRVRN